MFTGAEEQLVLESDPLLTYTSLGLNLLSEYILLPCKSVPEKGVCMCFPILSSTSCYSLSLNFSKLNVIEGIICMVLSLA